VKLLEALPALQQVWLDLTVVSPEAVSSLQLARELEMLELIRPSDEALAKITRLPKCRHMNASMNPQPLSAEGCRTLARLAAGIESLLLVGDPNSGGIDDNGLKTICQIDSLQELVISPGEITDEGLAHLARLKKLNHLELNYCLAVLGPGYAHLAPIQSLRRLEVKMARIDGAGFKALGGLVQLADMSLDLIDFPAASLKSADFAELKNMAHLESLTISSGESDTRINPAAGNAILSAAGQMPALKSLEVFGVFGINADGLEALAKSPRLEHLCLSTVSLDPRDAAVLGQMAALKELALYSTGPMKVEVAANLAKSQSLTELMIDGLSDDSLRQLASLHTLESLYVQRSEVTGTGLAALGELAHLKTLTLSNSPVNDQGSQGLRKLPGLEALNLSRTKITDRALDDIATLTNLRELNLAETAVTSEGIRNSQVLRKLTGLEELNLAKAKITDPVLDEIAMLPNLRELTLDDTAVTAEGLLKLRGLKQLRLVSAVGLKVSDEEVARLGEALPGVDIRVVEFGAYSLEATHLDAAGAGPEETDNFVADGAVITGMVGPVELEKQAKQIEQKIADGKATDNDLRALAQTLAFIRRDAKSLERAIGLYLDLATKGASDDDRMILARMYEKAGKWEQARDELKKVLVENPANPAVLVSLIQLLLRHDDSESLGPLMEQLEAITHDEPFIWQLKVRWLAKQGKTDEAVEYLESRIPNPVKRKDFSLVSAIASLLEELKQNDAAEKLMREAYGKDPSQTVAMASFLGRIGKLDDGLALYEQGLKTQLPQTLVAVLQTLRLNSASVTPKQSMTVMQWIVAGIEQDPESMPLQFALVDFLDLTGEYQASIDLYRKLLARPDLKDFQRAVAENNLAYLLVTRGKPNDLAEAQKLVDEAVKELGPVGSALDTRGLLRLAQGNLQGALDDFKVAVAESPISLNFFHLALAQEKAGDEAAWRAAFQRAVQLNLDPRQLPRDQLQSYQRLEQLSARPGKSD
jgi:tetratricopeptide (TPR) repeat protein/Leucine-rich repeat (LRR) protein